MFFSTGRTISPLEVQFNHSLWMPAAISFNQGSSGGDPINRVCQPNPREPDAKPCTNWTRVQGWSSVVATAPVAVPIGCGRGLDTDGFPVACPPEAQLNGRWCQNCTAHLLITGVRYAWAESPCCGGNLGNNIIPCPVNSCPISTFNSTLPAVPSSTP